MDQCFCVLRIKARRQQTASSLVWCMSILSMLGLMMLVLSGHETLMQQSVMCPPQPVPSVPPVCPGPGSHYRSLLSSAPRHSFSRHILDCGGGQGMVTGQVTRTTHCTYQLAGTCHLVSIQGLSIFILVDIWYFYYLRTFQLDN